MQNELIKALQDFVEENLSNDYKNVYIVINPKSVFYRNSKKTLKTLKLTGIRKNNIKIESFVSLHKGDMIDIVKKIIENKDVGLVMVFGGDGSSQMVVDTFCKFNTQNREFTICKVPFGSGNDGTSRNSFKDFLNDFGNFKEKDAKVSKIEFDNEVHYSQNVVSLGIDAYIVHIAHHTKFKFLGKHVYTYANLLAVFGYTNRFGKGFTLKMEADGIEKFNAPVSAMLMAFSFEGHRIYGGGYKVLPDEKNFIFGQGQNIFKAVGFSLAMKNGSHITYKDVLHFSVDTLKIKHEGEIPMQIDGEDLIIKPNTEVTFTRQNAPFKYYE